MSVKAAPPGPIFWILSGILCACTLAALLVTAIQIKDRKMAARYGERILSAPPASPDAPLPELLIRRGESARLEHLRLSFPSAADALEVRDSQDRPLARFTGLLKGQERGWQELRLKVLDVSREELRLAPEFRPGSPCFGAGTYLALKPGLRVDFVGDRSATLVALEPSAVRIRVEAKDRSDPASQEQSILADDRRKILGLTFLFHQGELSISE